jgi:maltose/maltodextrin transport system permease protein
MMSRVQMASEIIMAMVQPKSQKLRLLTTHLLLLVFIAAIMFPLLMVIAISARG